MLNIIKVLILLILQGCSTFVGVAYHLDADKPEYSGSNPLFIIRTEHNNMFCEHISSIKDKEKGYGFNMCGAGVKF